MTNPYERGDLVRVEGSAAIPGVVYQVCQVTKYACGIASYQSPDGERIPRANRSYLVAHWTRLTPVVPGAPDPSPGSGRVGG